MYIPRMRPRSRGIKSLRLERFSLDRVLMICMLAILLGDAVLHRALTNQSRQPIALQTTPHASLAPVFLQPSSDEDDASILKVDRLEYAQQIAISLIVNHDHEITDDRVVFKRNPKDKGTAIKQFSQAFGDAIQCGLETQESSSP
jgi:hypothetical protein